MKTTMRSVTVAGTLAVLLAACGGSPTSSAVADPAGPSYDGGYTVGSGNRDTPIDTTVVTSIGTDGTELTSQGGYTVGSGN